MEGGYGVRSNRRLGNYSDYLSSMLRGAQMSGEETEQRTRIQGSEGHSFPQGSQRWLRGSSDTGEG